MSCKLTGPTPGGGVRRAARNSSTLSLRARSVTAAGFGDLERGAFNESQPLGER